MSRITRLLPAAALAFATVALPVATAGPASATIAACVDHLASHGYQVTYEHEEACWRGSMGELTGCIEDLEGLDVWRYIAHEACLLAGRE